MERPVTGAGGGGGLEQRRDSFLSASSMVTAASLLLPPDAPNGGGEQQQQQDHQLAAAAAPRPGAGPTPWPSAPQAREYLLVLLSAAPSHCRKGGLAGLRSEAITSGANRSSSSRTAVKSILRSPCQLWEFSTELPIEGTSSVTRGLPSFSGGKKRADSCMRACMV